MGFVRRSSVDVSMKEVTGIAVLHTFHAFMGMSADPNFAGVAPLEVLHCCVM